MSTIRKYHGIEYELKDFIKWGEQLDSSQEVADEVVKDMDIIPGTNPKIRANSVNIKKTTISLLKRCLISWTFRGYDENGNLELDESKPILDITAENVAEIPGSHGTVLRQLIDELNSIPEDEAKKS